MNESLHIPRWLKLAAALLLLTSLLLGGIFAAAPFPVQALNTPLQINAPHIATSPAVSGTLASFTALIQQIFTGYLPFLAR